MLFRSRRFCRDRERNTVISRSRPACKKGSIEVSDDWIPNEIEKDLIRFIAKFPQVVEDSANKKRVHNITQYCQDLAGSFNKFYKSEQVIGYKFEDSRLILVDRAKTTLKNALNILRV